MDYFGITCEVLHRKEQRVSLKDIVKKINKKFTLDSSKVTPGLTLFNIPGHIDRFQYNANGVLPSLRLLYVFHEMAYIKSQVIKEVCNEN